MHPLIALVLALTVKVDLHEPKVLVENTGDMSPSAQLVSNFYVSKDVPVKLEAKGNGHGDLDCYLLRRNPRGDGWVVASKDESNLDQCSVSYSPTMAEPLRLWVVNHGVHPTTYTVTVKQ